MAPHGRFSGERRSARESVEKVGPVTTSGRSALTGNPNPVWSFQCGFMEALQN